MAPTGQQRPTIPPTADDASGWSTLCDALLRGMGHALSNRVGALMLFANADIMPPTSHDLAILPNEVDRLQELNRLLQLLPLDATAAIQALQPSEMISDTLALMRLHPEGRDCEWPLRESSAQPVRAGRSMLMRALLLLFDAARRVAVATGEKRIHLTVAGDDQTLEISARPARAGDVRIALPTQDLAPLLAAFSAQVTADGGQVVLRLPTLLELRRRERAARV